MKIFTMLKEWRYKSKHDKLAKKIALELHKYRSRRNSVLGQPTTDDLYDALTSYKDHYITYSAESAVEVSSVREISTDVRDAIELIEEN